MGCDVPMVTPRGLCMGTSHCTSHCMFSKPGLWNHQWWQVLTPTYGWLASDPKEPLRKLEFPFSFQGMTESGMIFFCFLSKKQQKAQHTLAHTNLLLEAALVNLRCCHFSEDPSLLWNYSQPCNPPSPWTPPLKSVKMSEIIPAAQLRSLCPTTWVCHWEQITGEQRKTPSGLTDHTALQQTQPNSCPNTCHQYVVLSDELSLHFWVAVVLTYVIACVTSFKNAT